MALLFKIIFVAIFCIVLISLGFALFFLTTDEDKDSKKMVNALTIRISLSIFLIVLLVIGYFSGLMQPNIP